MRDQGPDPSAQREILGVLVRTIENEHHLMDTLVKDDATKAILDIQSELKEPPCKETYENCRLGLGELAAQFAVQLINLTLS